MKKTKIICSIGPASCQVDVMEKMVLAGMNVESKFYTCNNGRKISSYFYG